VHYSATDAYLPENQRELVGALVQELASRPLSLLFQVETIATMPRAVPEFWLGVTSRLTPRLCGMAIVSPSLTVRSTATAIGLANRVRRVNLRVRGFRPAELEHARRWCEAQRSAAR
jgi:hypothetical protein